MQNTMDNMFDIVLDDSVKEESLNMLIKLEPINFYSHMEKNTSDLEYLFLAKMLHEGQRDKSGIDYMVHLIHSADIALKLKKDYEKENNCQLDSSILVQTLLLHDSLEDEIPKNKAISFNKTVEELLIEHDISDLVIDSINDMTRKDDEKYLNFIRRIKEKGNHYSILGKISDISSNNHPDRKSSGIKRSLDKRYNKAFNILKGNRVNDPSFKVDECEIKPLPLSP